MSANIIIAVITISAALHLSPVSSHRLITGPVADNEWDSIIVSSDPITVRERKQNHTTSLKPKQVLRAQKRSFEECPQNDFKCLYGSDEDKDNNQIIDKFLQQYSNTADVSLDNREPENGENFAVENENDNSRKSYWSMIDSQTHHHPYDDKNGWVTLDPIPWSASKISKWHPNKVGAHHEEKPWAYPQGFSTTQRPTQQFWVSGSSYHPQKPATQWGVGTNDLITDNKPSDFPPGNYNHFNKPHPPGYTPENGHYEYVGNYKDYQQSQGYTGNHPSRFPQTVHPSTHPSYGNGEWILLSTTKGYSFPQRPGWAGKSDLFKTEERFTSSRKIKPVEISRYHEEDLNEKFVLAGENPTSNRKSDVNADNKEDATANNFTNFTNNSNLKGDPLQILYTGSSTNEEPVKTFRRKVRLQVLPSLETTSTSYGGLLEVDSSSQTVDEAQQEDEKMNKLKALANIKKNKFRGYKLVPTNKVRGKGMSDKSAVTLAAVGAGMIPATMALLVPMALGRRKRSVSGFDPATDFEYNEEQKMRKW